VHPIERLRYVARARGADAESLVRETAGALRGLGLDTSGLVVACRRIVERHPTSGPLWWLCARMLTSADPMAAARAAVDEIERDGTVDEVTDALPDGATVVTIGWPDLVGLAVARRGDVRVLAVDAGHQGSSFVQRLERADVDSELVPTEAAAIAIAAADLVVLEADALDGSHVLAPTGSALLAVAATLSETPVWCVAGCGRRLPAAMIGAIIDRVAQQAIDPWSQEVEALPSSLVSHVIGPAGRQPMADVRAECEMAPELLRTGIM
jgi:Initiation factor 2 subunit family